MKPSLTLSEMNTLMDISFLFQSVRDLRVMSQKFLQLLGRVVPYEKAAVFLYQETRRQFSSCAEVRCGGGMIQAYIDIYSHLDYLGWKIFQSEEHVLRETDEVSPEERKKAKFYREYLQKNGMEYRLVLNARSSAGTLLGTVMLFRSLVFDDFNEWEVAVMEMLHNHFSAGIENAIRMEQAAVRENMAQTVYRTIPDVMILLNQNLEMQGCNEMAEQYLQELERTPAQKRDFFRAIRVCCQEMKEDAKMPDGSSERPDFRELALCGGIAKISMIRHTDIRGENLYDFIVVFSGGRMNELEGPALHPLSVEETRKRFFAVLKRQYSLTRREIDLITLALEGLENQKIAETLHISLFTVKSHFQNGYAKLGVKSRQELFLLYMRYLISEEFRQEFDAQTRKDDYL